LTGAETSTYFNLVNNLQFNLGRPDLDVFLFLARVTIAGGTLSLTEQLAISQLVVDMKAAGIWSKMKAIYPFVGASAAACAQNLKSSNFTGTFTATGWVFSSLGVKPNVAYMDTNFIASNELNLNSVHVCQYFNEGTDLIPDAAFDCGARVSGVGDLSVSWRYSDNGTYLRISTLANQFNSLMASNSGFRLASRTSSVLTKAYVNNTNVYTDTSTSVGLPTINMYIGRQNVNGTPQLASSKRIAFTSFGDGLTDIEASNLYTAVQRFQTTLGRQV
jgi:hypothetical protein